MSIQLLVFTIVLSVLLGFLALAISYVMNSKYELNYIRSYFYHQILIFLFGFYGLLGTIVANYFLIDAEIKSNLFKYIPTFLPFIGVPFMIVAWYLFIKISYEMIEKEVNFRFTLWFFISLTLIFLLFGFLVPYIDFFNVDQTEINIRVFIFFALIELISLILVFYILLVRSNALKEKGKIKFIKTYAFLNLILYAGSYILLMLGEKKIIFIELYTIFYFSKDIIPLLFINEYLKRNYIHPLNEVDGNTRELFIAKFGISKRESEIIEEIIKGKTNNQISESLFISLQTVKDHIHNIFLKTEVKNRVQLINLIRQFDRG